MMCHQDDIESPLYSADLPDFKLMDRDCTQRTDRGDPHSWDVSYTVLRVPNDLGEVVFYRMAAVVTRQLLRLYCVMYKSFTCRAAGVTYSAWPTTMMFGKEVHRPWKGIVACMDPVYTPSCFPSPPPNFAFLRSGAELLGRGGLRATFYSLSVSTSWGRRHPPPPARHG